MSAIGPVLSLPSVGARMDISEKSARDLANAGAFGPLYRTGTGSRARVRVSESAVEAYLAANRIDIPTQQ